MFNWQLYSQHFCSQAMQEVWSEQASIANWLLIEQQLAKVLAQEGKIPQAAANKLATITLADIDTKRLQRDMLKVGRPILGLTKQLKQLVGEPYQAFVHFGSTTQDIMDTAQMLQIKQGLALIAQQNNNLLHRLSTLMQENSNIDSVGRTNGQFAQPIKLAQKFAAWHDELTRRQQLLTQTSEQNLVVQIAGPVGNLAAYGESGDKIKQAMAQVLGLNSQASHWQNARDGIAEIVSAIGLLCGTVHKIAHNINLLSCSDIAEFRENIVSGKGASTSMTHKRNQRYSEFAEAVANLGKLHAEKINHVIVHEHERSGGAWIAEWFVVPQVFLLCSGALLWMEKLFAALVVDVEQVAANLNKHRLQVKQGSLE